HTRFSRDWSSDVCSSDLNGMEKFILSMNSTFSPDLRIEAVKGKTFDPNKNATFPELEKLPAVKNYSETLEDKVLIQHEGKQIVGQLKGITQERSEERRVGKECGRR